MRVYRWFDAIVGRIFHHPVRRLLKWALKQTRELIYRFIGYKRAPAYQQLRELRMFEPSKWQQLKHKREARKKRRGVRISKYHQRKGKK
jgi:hypothetical protein